MNNDQIRVLKIKRAVAKRALTAYIRFLKQFNSDDDFPILEKRFAEIEKTRETFLALQTELEILEDDSEEVHQHLTEFEDAYFGAYKIAYKILFPDSINRSCQPSSSMTVTAKSSESSGIMDQSVAPENNQQSGSTVQSSNTQSNFVAQPSCLPTISLPTFSGRFDDWLGFYDLFNSLIHEDISLSPVRKLFYLKSCLIGEAASVISSIESSSQNYEVAWNLLKERYDDRKLIRENYIQALLNTPFVSKEFSIRSFLDNIQKNLRALKSLGEPVDSWSSLLIIIIKNKFPMSLQDRWDEYSNGITNPTIEQIINFLTRRAQIEVSHSQMSCLKSERPKVRIPPQPRQAFPTSVSKDRCLYCLGNDHFIGSCSKFTSLSTSARYETTKNKGWCSNCLRNTHKSAQCAAGKCRKCGQKHHTLLHFEKLNKPNQADNNNSNDNGPLYSQIPSTSVNLHALVSSEVLLATAIIDIVGPQGTSKSCKAFLDAGSQANFITEATAKFLKLEQSEVSISVSGIDDLSVNIKHATRATVKSKFNKFSKNIEFLVVPQISKAMPSAPIDHNLFEIPKNIILADPEFAKPSTIEVLLGVNIFYKLLSVGQIKLKNHPDAILQKTQLGWVIAGSIENSFKRPNLTCHFSVTNRIIDFNISRFWEIEELPSTKILSHEEKLCEKHYLTNTTRDSTGRYIVRLPFKNNPPKLGTSYTTALRRFQSLEKRFSHDNSICNDYISFLQEYQALNHMSRVNQTEESSGFYLPHHAVVKKDSLTTKTRVVFDGSAKSSNGLSLNDTLMVGPKLQDDLFIILTRFRCHAIALTADIEKMYRQIRVHPNDTKYQKILFRSNPCEKISTFALSTVTYGTSCASYLAIRSLQQLAEDEGKSYPSAAVIVKRDFYVDDLLTGASNHQEAKELCKQLNELLKKGGFVLRKWASNDPSLLRNNDEHSSTTLMSLDPDETIKTLGIHWNAKEDIIFYSVNISKNKRITKRSILSKIAQLFDPLGLLGPIILHAKILMQQLWKAGLAWDESVPINLHSAWITYLEQLPLIQSIKFNRCFIIKNSVTSQVHGFCDASERAYGACLYLRSADQDGKVQVRLICSKSRVAPISSISLPRLELCGALLLSRLYNSVKQALVIKIDNTYLWSDSTIVLHWINTSPHLLKTFVSNRVAEIQRLTTNCHWRHVSSFDNPADKISRGQLPADFLQEHLWQQGPDWLSEKQALWPRTTLSNIKLPDLKSEIPSKLICMKLQLRGFELCDRYSSFDKTTRIFAYIHRFINNLKCKPSQRTFGILTTTEMNAAHDTIILMVQMSAFASEINSLRNRSLLGDRSKLIPLSPFLDNKGILRVGGRLYFSDLAEEQRHPILLPPRHHITRIIIKEEHERLHHAGAQATLYSVRQTYWPLNSRNLTRKIIHECMVCFRATPRFADHIMGNLPSYRVTKSRPFLHVGVDYCGPLYIKEKRFRNRQKIKSYIAIYVCMSTKAVHLELVSDFTTEAFIGCLKRFFSRRGLSTDIYSDNATNFVGASRHLKDLYNLFNSPDNKKSIQSFMLKNKINWHFIPPRSPHFGGLWEAAVKSFKTHLQKTVGKTLLTYEQLETFIIEIEAILNSRPISPLSSDPNDFLPLTPGHFLIGGPLTSFPQQDYTKTRVNHLSAWQHAQQLRQHFWKRWYKEYLHQLMIRPSHQKKYHNIDIGTMVLISEDNLPPLQWSLGRVSAVHPGQDGVIRAVTLKTVSGEYQRSTKRLCPLPIEDNVTV